MDHTILLQKAYGQRVGLCAGRNFCSTARRGRNFLVHGQNTTARSESQLLNIPILPPGWRKAHVVWRAKAIFLSDLSQAILYCSKLLSTESEKMSF